jgi:uncharacterized protein (TIGR02271 family)
MTAPRIDTVKDWYGRTLVDADGDEVGKISDIYLDNDTGQPEWALVSTGQVGANSAFVPIAEARTMGGSIQVPYTRTYIDAAPGAGPDGELSGTEEDELYRHYGIRYSGTGARDPDADPADPAVGHNPGGSSTDNAMTRSEEELEVRTRTREAGRARMRKYVVTNDVTATVPVQREEVRLEREPITDANAGAAVAGDDITEEEHEVTLHEEEPVVSKRVVPKERVRLDVDTVTEQATVTEQVRKEVIEVDTPETTKDRPQH